MTLTVMDWFCGAGGSSQGLHVIPGVHVGWAANHWEKAIESHSANFPFTDHWIGDIRDEPVEGWPIADIFWASPECPQWSAARGKKQTYQHSLQGELFDADPRGKKARDAAERSRALMEEVPLYLEGVIRRGGRVWAGVVENVVEVRKWDQWDRWLNRIRRLGYRVRVIALNSMHAQPGRTPAAPQSRDRLYVAYWHESIAREPDWDKWLRPMAYCEVCDEWVQAVQAWKKPGADMGRYRAQYTYRCPRVKCRNAVLEPPAVPAAAAIDWSLPGTRIGDRETPLAEKTMERIRIGLRRYAVDTPLMVPAGGTWRDDATPVAYPMAARTTRENDGVAIPAPFLALLRSGRPRTIGLDEQLATIVADGSGHGLVTPPLVVPMEGREGKQAQPASMPLRTQTARAETGLAFLPFVTELRGGGSDARSVRESLATVTASGNHHGLVTPPAGMPPEVWRSMLLPYYGTARPRPVGEPVGALTSRDRYALVDVISEQHIEDVRFRMLEPHEIGRAMAFGEGYVVVGSKRDKVRQYGNAVTPPCAEVIVSALVEAITGEEIERWPSPDQPQLAAAA
ncbi:DNA cytosine methyltransferase [Nocardia farcinica]|uniref:DNA cytosine methyltransferase n=1 Tax=Nocardia farcinica TaxID=37329 RepID=UPI001894D6E5|nr:DNA cytosine methyltransferase [Nocardia farcinica]MBF6388172.1 DNA cytosine methyltransferase [Nocardia farcinica]UEX26326.1 DNA cytosine methyltransferase [Nocardia farcinica]